MKTKQKYWSATLVSCERRPSGCVALFLKSAIVKTVYTPAYVTNYIIATKKLTRMVSEMAKKLLKRNSWCAVIGRPKGGKGDIVIAFHPDSVTHFFHVVKGGLLPTQVSIAPLCYIQPPFAFPALHYSGTKRVDLNFRKYLSSIKKGFSKIQETRKAHFLKKL